VWRLAEVCDSDQFFKTPCTTKSVSNEEFAAGATTEARREAANNADISHGLEASEAATPQVPR
jgi:hypothetical protein